MSSGLTTALQFTGPEQINADDDDTKLADLVVRSDEHLRYEKEQPRGEIKTHLRLCEMCKKSTIDNFEIVKKCLTDQEAKINEALIIKKENPQLNKNLFNKGSLFTLNIYY